MDRIFFRRFTIDLLFFYYAIYYHIYISITKIVTNSKNASGHAFLRHRYGRSAAAMSGYHDSFGVLAHDLNLPYSLLDVLSRLPKSRGAVSRPPVPCMSAGRFELRLHLYPHRTAAVFSIITRIYGY